LDSDIRGNYKYELIANKADGCLLQVIDLQEDKIIWGQKYEIRPDVEFLDDKALMVVTRDDFGDRDNLLIYNIANGDILQKIQLHGGYINVSRENGNIVIEENSGSPFYRVIQYVLDSTNYDILSTDEYTEPYSVISISFIIIMLVVAGICLFLLIRDRKKKSIKEVLT